MNKEIINFHTFSQPAPKQPITLEAMADRIKSIQSQNPAERAKLSSEDAKLWDILATLMLSIAGQPGGFRALLKIPDNQSYDIEELRLAAWVLEVQKKQGIPYKDALDKVLACIRRNPKALANFTGQEVEFSEALVGNCLAGTRPQPVDAETYAKTLDVLRRSRIYQASHPGASIVEAVYKV